MLWAAFSSVSGAAVQEPDAQTCLRADYSPAVIPAFGHVQPLPYSADETACWLDVQKAHGGDWTLLDVREVGVSERTPLSGTVAMSLASLADRKYLRDQPLVLVGTGVDLRVLTRSCMALRQQGFARLRVLLGGARSWHRTRGVDMLTPQEVWLGGIDGQWRIVSVGLQADQVASLPIPPEITLSASVEGATLQHAILDTEKAKPSEPPHQWLVVASDDMAQQAVLVRWQQTVQVKESLPVAWLSGGWSDYRAYLDQQQHSAAHAGRALPSSCGS